jgi:hypothetical protein
MIDGGGWQAKQRREGDGALHDAGAIATRAQIREAFGVRRVYRRFLRTARQRLWSARTCPRFGTGRHVCQSESGDVSPHSTCWREWANFPLEQMDFARQSHGYESESG